jgi:hypothetical protein
LQLAAAVPGCGLTGVDVAAAAAGDSTAIAAVPAAMPRQIDFIVSCFRSIDSQRWAHGLARQPCHV